MLDVYFVSDIRQSIIAALVVAVETHVANGCANVEHLGGILTMAKGAALAFGIPWPFVVNGARVALGTGYDELLAAAGQRLIGEGGKKDERA